MAKDNILAQFGLDNVDAETKAKIEALISKTTKQRKKTGIREYAESYGTESIYNKFELILASILKLYPGALDQSQRVVEELDELKLPNVEYLKLISSLVDWKLKGDSLHKVEQQLESAELPDVDEVEDVVDLLDDVE